jgi:hypothetical protein
MLTIHCETLVHEIGNVASVPKHIIWPYRRSRGTHDSLKIFNLDIRLGLVSFTLRLLYLWVQSPRQWALRQSGSSVEEENLAP